MLLRLAPGGREEGEVRVWCNSSEPHGALWFISHRHTPADTRPPRPCHSLLVLGCTVPLLESGRQVGDGDKLVYRLAVRCPPSLPDTSHQHHSSIGKHAQQQQEQTRRISTRKKSERTLSLSWMGLLPCSLLISLITCTTRTLSPPQTRNPVAVVLRAPG